MGRTVLNMLVVWALTGLWHGASWNFVVWGLYFFVFLALERLFLLRWLERLPRWLRGDPVPKLFPAGGDAGLGAVQVHRYAPGAGGAAGPVRRQWQSPDRVSGGYGAEIPCVLSTVLPAGLHPLFRWAGEKWREAGQKNRLLARLYGLAAWGVMPVLLLLLSTASLVGNSYNPFLYFQF